MKTITTNPALDAVLAKKRAQYGDKFDTSDLAPQFAKYWGTDTRITVQFAHGTKMRGRVGITTGWKPVFLLMLRSNSRGSSWTLGNDDKII